MDEVGPITYSTEPALLWLADTVIGEGEAHKIFHGAIITLVGWHGYGRREGPKTYFAESAFLWLAGTVIREVGTHDISHGAINTVVRWHAYGRGLEP